MGATEETIQTEEIAPSFAEAWRIAWQVKTLRRIWYSLPFLAAAVIGLAALLSRVLRGRLRTSTKPQRGFVFAGAELTQIAGILIGVPIANRLLVHRARQRALVPRRRSARSSASCGPCSRYAPTLPVAIAMHVLLAGALALLAPGIYAALSLAIPPRIRALGFSIGSLFIVPGVLVLVDRRRHRRRRRRPQGAARDGSRSSSIGAADRSPRPDGSSRPTSRRCARRRSRRPRCSRHAGAAR